MTHQQCSSCGGFCKKSGCERDDARPATHPATPEGWKLVPIEPTQAMLNEMNLTGREGYDEIMGDGFSWSLYSAAIRVAPLFDTIDMSQERVEKTAKNVHEQDQGEPIGEVVLEDMGVRGSDAMQVRLNFYKEIPPLGTKIYTTPPKREWVELTDEEIEAKFKQCGGKWDGDQWLIEDADLHPFVRSIESPDLKTLQAISDEYNAWIRHHAAGHTYDDFLARRETARGIKVKP